MTINDAEENEWIANEFSKKNIFTSILLNMVILQNHSFGWGRQIGIVKVIGTG